MTYAVQVSSAALRSIKKLDQATQRRVQAVIELLSQNPRPPAAIKLVNGGGAWRVRTGNYRIIYEIHDQELRILILRAGHRKEIYTR